MPLWRISRYVSARSGLRSVDPTAGARPPGRYSARVELNWANELALLFAGSAIWSWNGLSTGNPSSATLIAGSREWASDRVPHLSRADGQVIRLPGTPTEIPLTRASWKAYGLPVAG